MPLMDLPLDQLREYRPERNEPADFDEFWSGTITVARQHAATPVFEPVDVGLRTVDVADVTFPGYNGDPIKGWLLLPRGQSGRLPAVVTYIGYGGGRGRPYDWLFYSSAGYANLIMDTRGQGSTWLAGHTPDVVDGPVEPQHPGFLTRGVSSPQTYYYRRLVTDAVRAVDAVRSHPAVDPDRVAVNGHSQGGAMGLAVAALVDDVLAACLDVPAFSDFARAVDVAAEGPYVDELVAYLKIHRHQVDQVMTTLSYVDGLNFAARAKIPALFSVALMDPLVPPSTVFAAYNHYAGPKDISVWRYNAHEGGQSDQQAEHLRLLREVFGEDA
jgi:cephalosporin-C deacetylase